MNVLGNRRSFRVHLLTRESEISGGVGRIPQFGLLWQVDAQPVSHVFSVDMATECANRRRFAAQRVGELPQCGGCTKGRELG